jgi:hypothetical protein
MPYITTDLVIETSRWCNVLTALSDPINELWHHATQWSTCGCLPTHCYSPSSCNMFVQPYKDTAPSDFIYILYKRICVVSSSKER